MEENDDAEVEPRYWVKLLNGRLYVVAGSWH